MIRQVERFEHVRASGTGAWHPRRPTAPLAATALLALLALGAPSPSAAHEIPADVTIRTFVKPEAGPEGARLRFLVRVPLEAMRDYDFPVRGAGYLDLAAARDMLRAAARRWIADPVRFYEDGEAVGEPEIAAVRVSLPSDRSFGSWEAAVAHVTGDPLPETTDIPPRQALLDVLLEYPVRSVRSDFSVESELARLGLETATVLRFVPPQGPERAYQYVGDPGLVRLDPSWHHAAWRFVVLGFRHILDGADHLLFLLCLVIPFRRFWRLVPIVTAFTVAHSITLLASATGLAPRALWFPPLIEALVAASIVYMALENIVGAKLHRRWPIAFAFGLVHGFGFSFALSETLQFAGGHLLTSLLSFNVGVEAGQLFVLLLTVPLLELLVRHVVAERVGIILASALLAHTGWHWMTDRGTRLLQYDLALPTADLALVAVAMRWLMLLLIAGGAAWLLRGLYGKLMGRVGGAEATVGAEG